ncbi:hypothetical protein K2173_021910 [Erythroxylum novogranatense]|uniref:GCK domain-containing protein n=1 Tax=Erythroxylum novogranatense TaxID=1862640 RepID=A0AAV8T294_9ROSI|nr:hypothetical protein K2173_021910 [Erythroxylum novogranatense]
MSSSPPQTPFSTTRFPEGYPREYALPFTNNEISDESDHPEQPIEANNEDNNHQEPEDEDEDEEEGECGFCLFMKGGGCKEAFIAWENCVQEGENNKEDIVEKCFEVTSALKKCMDAHSDYYEPILRAEKAAEEEAVKELEKEIAVKDSPSNEKDRGEPPLDSKDCEEGEKNKDDIVEKCLKLTADLRRCIDVNKDYYESILRWNRTTLLSKDLSVNV